MKRRLTHCDIKQDRWYKVVKAPDHWYSGRYKYGVLGKVGRCQWVQSVHGVSLIFNNCLERLVPPDCLEPAVNPDKKIEKIVGDLNENTVKIGNVYLVHKEPLFYKNTEYSCPVIGKFGKLVALRGSCCLLLFGKDREQHLVPFGCLTECGREPSKRDEVKPDSVLIMKIIDNPEGTLKIIKGLAKMTKNCLLKNFLERGDLK